MFLAIVTYDSKYNGSISKKQVVGPHIARRVWIPGAIFCQEQNIAPAPEG
jgi:hypothetical protein